MLRHSETSLTLEEFLQSPETQPASEYNQGRVSQKPMPQGQHSTLQVDLTETINAATKRQKIARAYTEIRCIIGDRVIVPDIGVFTWDRIPTDAQGNVANQFNLAPNWLIEILSPHQATIPVIDKILYSLNQGTDMGWLIDPDTQTIVVYPAQQQPQVFHNNEAMLPIPDPIPALNLSAADIFAWLKHP
ncbi:Uma2 family endonuclease [Phormidium yuhuli AB48]|uniref:Uma2 family endonuclease n=1 Tax=Phormidium yuhuli AB48 TaxID=2940671 RepID=A0ABY5AT25_9CYAN|nr:Uma2 family endonuclease [Phormidium yuhuli]USR91911.1 Uma2 family endonuclease [Phormidium yuhuli AB48]